MTKIESLIKEIPLLKEKKNTFLAKPPFAALFLTVKPAALHPETRKNNSSRMMFQAPEPNIILSALTTTNQILQKLHEIKFHLVEFET